MSDNVVINSGLINLCNVIDYGDLFVQRISLTGSSNIKLPLPNYGIYNFDVDWGDGSPVDTITAFNQAEADHFYSAGGVYTITISGQCTAWSNGPEPRNEYQTALIEVVNFGNMGWTNLFRAFEDCSNLSSFSGGNVDNVTTIEKMFYTTFNISSFDLSTWNTANISSFKDAFRGISTTADVLNPDVSGFDMSGATDVSGMFAYCDVANPDVSGWDVSNISDFSLMFIDTSAADPDTTSWVTTSATNMAAFASGATGWSSVNANPNAFWNNPGITTFTNAFDSAVNIPNFASIPAGWK